MNNSARLEGVKDLKKLGERPIGKSGKKRKAYKLSAEKVMKRQNSQRKGEVGTAMEPKFTLDPCLELEK